MKKTFIFFGIMFLTIACSKVNDTKTSDVDSTKVDSVSVVDSTK